MIFLIFTKHFKAQQNESTGHSNLLLLFAIIGVLVISFIFLNKWLKKSSFYDKVLDFIEGLKEGFKSIKNMKRKSAFWFHSFSIWIMYFLMTYICFFSMQETSHLTAGDGLFLLVLGGIGMVIPTPGGVGSYHAIVMIGLSVLGVGDVFLGEGGDPTNPALLFPTIVHVAQKFSSHYYGVNWSTCFIFIQKEKQCRILITIQHKIFLAC